MKKNNAIIINMAASQIQTNEAEKERLEKRWSTDYKLTQESLLYLLLNIDETLTETPKDRYSSESLGGTITKTVRAFTKGLVVDFVREPYTVTLTSGYFDEEVEGEYDTTPTEEASLYILDDGRIFYVHRGFYFRDCATELPIRGYEFPTESFLSSIEEELGRHFEVSPNYNNVRNAKIQYAIRKKKEFIASMIKSMLKKGKLREVKAEGATICDTVLPTGFEWCREKSYEATVEYACSTSPSALPEDVRPLRLLVKNKKGETEPFYTTTFGDEIVTPEEPFRVTEPDGHKYLTSQRDLIRDFYIKDISEIWGKRIKVYKRVATKEEYWIAKKLGNGNYLVVRHIDGMPEYMTLSSIERKKNAIIELYEPTLVYKDEFELKYDHGITKSEVKTKSLKNKNKENK